MLYVCVSHGIIPKYYIQYLITPIICTTYDFYINKYKFGKSYNVCFKKIQSITYDILSIIYYDQNIDSL